MPELRTLLVHRDPQARERLAGLLRDEGLQVGVAAGAHDGAGTLSAQPPALVVTDEATAQEGLADACASLDPRPILVVIAETLRAVTGGDAPRGDGAVAVPAGDDEALREAVAAVSGSARRSRVEGLESVLGPSKAMMELRATAARLAASRVPILIRGEAGTGRELLARAIHGSSPRAAGPFVVVDCATLPARVLENELFGGGAPTAATAPAALLRQAHGGTLYLHEITGASPGLSARLLHVLSAGATRAEGPPLDVRLVGSTREEPRAGTRSDVAARLDVTTLRLPPLRERAEDVPVLAEHFAARYGRGRVGPEVLEVLRSHPWPGNVRELEQAIARAAALASGGPVLVENLPAQVRGEGRQPVAGRPGDRPSLQELERRYAQEVLAETGGNKSRTAEILGIDRKTLYRLLGLTPPPASKG